jgi:hypothetical protein
VPSAEILSHRSSGLAKTVPPVALAGLARSFLSTSEAGYTHGWDRNVVQARGEIAGNVTVVKKRKMEEK